MKPYITVFTLNFLATNLYALPKDFVYLHDLAPLIIEDLRYLGSNNFIGHPIPGYTSNRCILTKEAALQLAKVEQAALKRGYTLKVYDCYRPQKAVDAFYRWSQNPRDNKMKECFYPREEKAKLFEKGYIAKASGHTRGSTVDLTLVKWPNPFTPSRKTSGPCYGKNPSYQDDNSMDTGTRFDCMDRTAHITYRNLTKQQLKNRQLLQNLMVRFGFSPYPEEWWHFTLKHEPFPNSYFNFPVA
ncbi:D-alanyl-D-alanine dipeptidase [Legionella jordanis]|uniref:D-alanyl-D-alanine dipeptidase n=1 Tax=Legionella jordanis TaxID=456 RepID=A0A0W0VDM1_9GAMM|nr:M15 family metallopeptidase [Legionella jordanis]KTD18229.1 D-alanyl-D-alanine dipeptidase [Legionella jordanis]RMX01187.1 D-alanyl-D-alanine dipeptidase [Legionella jordanis]RMX21417.1 D-alanyl-D-alanine dipeptidase [Legionella jordanis]VEH13678.1 D-alanyl-D-alanine dipeptidase [Legionella jordanis]